MAGVQAFQPMADFLRTFQRRLMLLMYYAALVVVSIVALAAVLMCSGSELATILMAVTVFAFGLVLGKGGWIRKRDDIKDQGRVRKPWCPVVSLTL